MRYKRSTVMIIITLILLTTGLLHPPDAGALKKKSAEVSSEGPYQGVSEDGRVECSGVVEPKREFSLMPSPQDRIVQCLRKPGERVASGDLLMKLESSSLSEQYLSLLEKRLALKRDLDKIALLKTKMKITADDIARLGRQIENERQVREKIPDYLIEGRLGGWLTEKRLKENAFALLKLEVDQFNRRFADFQAVSLQTDSAISAVEERLRKLDVKAPFDGLLAAVRCDSARTPAGQPILVLQDDQNMMVVAKAWQNQLPYIHSGNRVKVFPNSFKKDFFWGTVHNVGPAEKTAGAQYPVFPVTVDLEDPPPHLRAGMAVSVQILRSGDR